MPTPDRLAEIAKTLEGFAAELKATEVPTPIPNVPPVGSAVARPAGATADMKLIFSDEFTGSALDLTKWRKGDYEKADGYFRDFDTKSQAFYIPEQVIFRDGHAVLQAVKRRTKVVIVNNSQKDDAKGTLTGVPGKLLKNSFVRGDTEDTYYSTWDLQRNLQYQSGVLTTSGDRWTLDKSRSVSPTFSFKHGWFEASIKMPAPGKGLWPAMWTKEVTESRADELDAFEMVDPQRRRIAQHLHWGPKGAANDWTANTNLGWDSGLDLSADFHTYGINWQADKVEWYFDGKRTQICTDRSKIPTSFQYLLLNLAVAGDWAGYPDASTMFPAEMLVDWVRVWQ